MRTMPQFGLLFMLVVLPMSLLSGDETRLEAQPETLQVFMQLVPSTHFVSFAQAILFRGADFAIVRPHFAAVAALRFRKSIVTT